MRVTMEDVQDGLREIGVWCGTDEDGEFWVGDPEGGRYDDPAPTFEEVRAALNDLDMMGPGLVSERFALFHDYLADEVGRR